MALALLKEKFGDDIDFEQKCLRINYGPESIGLDSAPPIRCWTSPWRDETR